MTIEAIHEAERRVTSEIEDVRRKQGAVSEVTVALQQALIAIATQREVLGTHREFQIDVRELNRQMDSLQNEQRELSFEEQRLCAELRALNRAESKYTHSFESMPV